MRLLWQNSTIYRRYCRGRSGLKIWLNAFNALHLHHNLPRKPLYRAQAEGCTGKRGYWGRKGGERGKVGWRAHRRRGQSGVSARAQGLATGASPPAQSPVAGRGEHWGNRFQLRVASPTAQNLAAGVGGQVFLAQLAYLHMGVDLRSGYVGVPQHFLDGAKVCPALQQMRGKRMAQGVRVKVLHADG